MEEYMIRKELYNIMQNEYGFFLKDLRKLPRDKILLKSYEKVIKSEFLSIFHPDNDEIDIDVVIRLKEESKPLNMLYEEWVEYSFDIGKVYEKYINKVFVKKLKEEE